MEPQTFEELKVLGVRFHKITVCQLIDYVIESSRLNRKTVIGHVNTRAMNFACDLTWYRDFFNNADLVFCDGFGVLVGAKMLGYSVQSDHRMTCPDYIENLAMACERNGISLFLLAGQPGVTDKAITKMHKVAPNLRVEGQHGHFDKSGKENEEVIKKINQFKPDVLYVGFGMPLQERWIVDNFDRLDTRVFLPLGACLDFYTDTVYRGPQWMTESGFEWLSRLVVEPNRLWRRYILGNPLFFYRVLKQRASKLLSKS